MFLAYAALATSTVHIPAAPTAVGRLTWPAREAGSALPPLPEPLEERALHAIIGSTPGWSVTQPQLRREERAAGTYSAPRPQIRIISGIRVSTVAYRATRRNRQLCKSTPAPGTTAWST
jgi:hypothetical protein